MKSKFLANALMLFLWLSLMNACGDKQTVPSSQVLSPSGNIKVKFFLTADKAPAYQVFFHDQVVIDTSLLGFELKDQPALKENFEIVKTVKDSLNENWELPWGEQREVVNNYNELTVSLKEN
ncbi:MAG TPA: glycoside hydrolase family 97 N-terminal domain-containing protein, partial [Salinimicrobium sp.]|nr:glycoside hydrolase family 97 N-terminal domain-containing protein [Salinimicrobium sp.]